MSQALEAHRLFFQMGALSRIAPHGLAHAQDHKEIRRQRLKRKRQ